MPYFNVPQLCFKCNWVMICRILFIHSDHSLGDGVALLLQYDPKIEGNVKLTG